MVDQIAPELLEEVIEVRRKKRWIYGAALLFTTALLGVGYWQRVNVATRIAQDQLAKYDVTARYTIKNIGLRTQRLENIVIGDPANPDFSAKWAELDVSINFSGATITDVRAGGVRLHGRYVDGKVSFGELDKFRDPKNTAAFNMPDWDAALQDAVIRFDTPWGRVGAALSGSGLLRHRFDGRLSVRAPQIDNGDCLVEAIRFDGQFIIDKRQPGIIGPLLANSIRCAQSAIGVNRPRLGADVRLSEHFDRWFGKTDFAAAAMKMQGLSLDAPRGKLDFDGKAARTNFNFFLDQAAFKDQTIRVSSLGGTAQGHVDFSREGVLVAARGTARFAGAALDRSYLSRTAALVKQTQDTPVGPLLAKIIPALNKAATDLAGNLRYDANIAPESASSVSVDGVRLSARTGMRVVQSGSVQITGNQGKWQLKSPVAFVLSGGDMPDARIALGRNGANGWRGSMKLASYGANGASLAIPTLGFVGNQAGLWRFSGNALVTGPLPGGSIKGLAMPIQGNFDGRNLTFYQSCQIVAFESARLSSLSLSRQSLRICPDVGHSIFRTGPGGTRIVANLPALLVRGAVGNTPLSARSMMLSFHLNDGFRAQNVKFALGQPDALTEFDISTLTGKFGRNGPAGTIEDGKGQIANVPLLISQAGGNWRYANGIFDLDGQLRVSDAAREERFMPLSVPDMQLSFENSVISAIGTLHEPKTGRLVSDVDIRHDLKTTTGRALLSVDNLTFGPAFQPELLTPLTLGVVANVDGRVDGDARINWDNQGVRSTGRFGTDNISLAAAFGPVEGLATKIQFSDLLGFETLPGQVATIASANPGIAALNGKITYQLLSGNRVKVEGGRWPFAGGELILDPTILDFDVNRPRLLTFRAVGVDAEKFLAPYEFDNLRVSGTFDGTLPMIFDQQGGRIVGGSMKARAGGGELSYIGELSYKDMGVFANYAFQALKSIRYRELEISVDGDIAGEIITKVSFAGVQQGSLAKRNFITKQLARIPIKFNVSITAQFLQLVGSIRGLYDPDYALSRSGLNLVPPDVTPQPVIPAIKPQDE